MRRPPVAVLVALLALGGVGCTATSAPWTAFPPDAPLPLDPAVEADVDAWMAQMTLEDKVAQLHGVSILPPADGLWPTPDDERLGIPGFRMVDGPRGLIAGVATSFPVAMARAATFDTALEQAVGQAIGEEASARGADVLLAPTINVLRHPAWGRAQETYGEDPFLLGAMGVAFVDGAQTELAASVKHFAVNSIEDTRFDVDVTVDERTLREVYLPHFRKVVRDAHVATVMSAYNKVNGQYCAENPHLLTDVLRDDWGFQGLVESDWVLGTRSTAPALQAGLDLEMPDQKFFGEALYVQARDGVIDVALVDRAVRRVLRTKRTWDVGGTDRPDASVIGSAAHADLARRAAAEAIVLLDNDGLLPLDEGSLGSVVVVGALADTPNTGDAGSSNVTPDHVVTPWQGLVAALGAERATLVPRDVLDTADADAVAGADVAVVVVGLTAEDEGENIAGRPGGDRERLTLSPTQEALIADVAARNPSTVVVLQGGSAIVPGAWRDDVGAIVMAWYAGQEGGTALADVLLGLPPTGHLPLSVPVSADDLVAFDATSTAVTYGYLHGYRQLDADGIAPAWAFGHGLTYGTVTVDAATATVEGTGTDAVVTVGFDVSATVATDAVVQVYASKADAVFERPPQVLVGFSRLAVPPGGATSGTVTVPARELAVWFEGDDDTPAGFVLEHGPWTLSVGTSSRSLTTSVDVDL
ncbi:MAG: glycoside hydrolase family 3 C-terminal domain-containing protein [Alphaproteobacteria bacterium]|nr:glycoside hydrolase family 3 C-terminal domain-containing protein [Alphaproteobacteria bacterium]